MVSLILSNCCCDVVGLPGLEPGTSSLSGKPGVFPTTFNPVPDLDLPSVGVRRCTATAVTVVTQLDTQMAPRLLNDASPSQHTSGDGDTHPYQDEPTEQLAMSTGPGANPVAQLQADQRQGDADPADNDGRHSDADVIGAQGEPDREIVDAQRCPGDEQASGVLASRGLVLVVLPTADGLHDGIGAGCDQQRCADPVR